ncbi:hypothetical protein K7A41_00555 [Sphingobacterium sp. InxBP1]|uniref:hypothetical protein n=1 Tax=Sphingobacterium sp. InxBP1 TaxID=2870328 RepID=UPI0022447784|nr:hypothetical protein [Sphingobacterium sp. InxBP1]MCW8309711.1 hypothetical protein [Sphingobacterium sp. InxBP1]
MNRKVLSQIVFVLLTVCYTSQINAQTATFIKSLNVNATTKVELTDASSQPLKVGGLYRVKLSIISTGTRTGAEYLAWYDSPASAWKIRMVSAAGQNSNHPLLIVEDNIVKVYTNHANIYAVRAFVEFYDTGNGNVVPDLFGASFHWQRSSSNLFYTDGAVDIGTETPRDKLSVNGRIRAQEVKVETANWPDYVFHDNYDLKSLDSLRTFITQNGHLPEVPSAKTVESEGVDLGEMNKLLLKKIEELTLYLLQKDEEISEIRRQLNQRKD